MNWLVEMRLGMPFVITLNIMPFSGARDLGYIGNRGFYRENPIKPVEDQKGLQV